MTLAERLLAEKLYEAQRGQGNRTYAHGHSFEEWLGRQLSCPRLSDSGIPLPQVGKETS